MAGVTNTLGKHACLLSTLTHVVKDLRMYSFRPLMVQVCVQSQLLCPKILKGDSQGFVFELFSVSENGKFRS